MKLEQFRSLPDDIIGVVWTMLGPETKALLDRANFEEHHEAVYRSIGAHRRLSYHRVIMRHDDSYVFEKILRTEGLAWARMKRFPYDTTIHNNYLYFLLFLVQEHGAARCGEMIKSYFDKEGVGKNVYKKYRIKNIRWSN